MFDELMEHLREQVMGAHFRTMAEGMRDASPEELARFRDMLAELNDMIERRTRGEPYDFDGFMQRYGDLFPDDPQSLDELLENMARRMAAMSRLMASLSPEQRAELQALADQVMQDMDLAFEVDRLGANLASASPTCAWGEPALRARARGRRRCRPRWMRSSGSTTTKSSTARPGQDYPGASIEDVDEDAVRRRSARRRSATSAG